MARPLRLNLAAALLLAAPVLFLLAPRTAQASCSLPVCYDVDLHEYVNEISGHYLLLPAGDPEVAIVEGGGAGPGWTRTGNDFSTNASAPLPVCRFYSPVFDTHFYTASASECESVKRDPAWIYEKSPFNAYPASGGACDNFLSPVYRLSRVGDHRYSPDPAIRTAMLARGWADEGVAFCAAGNREAVLTLFAGGTRVDTVQACQSAAGSCTAVDSLPPMTNRVPTFLDAAFSVPNPSYPAQSGAVVGWDFTTGDLLTGQAADPTAILQHSFITQGGLFINGHDRTGGDYAGISPMVELPGVAGPGGDERLFIWRTPGDRELRLASLAYIGEIVQDSSGSQAYGGFLMQFGDATTGRSFVATVQAYGTAPPGDFVAPDARTGEPIVSTVFRPNPMFGRVLGGSFIACPSSTVWRCAPFPEDGEYYVGPGPFVFSMQRVDFQGLLAHARTLDPALSANPADYFLARVEFKNETYLDARVGAITTLAAQIWYIE